MATIESLYNLNQYTIVKDSKDSYIEVDNEDEAELIERLNKLEIDRSNTYLTLIAKRNIR